MSVFEASRKMTSREQTAYDLGFHEGRNAAIVHGRWVNPYINRYGHPCHCCSECGFKASYQDKNYCPDCGAKMDGGADNENP